MDQPWLWITFNLAVVVLLALDLFVFHRVAHEVRKREAAIWSIVWIALALAFAAGVYFFGGRELALEFLAGYIIEKSLSIDNIFVFVLIFGFFQVPPRYQHRVLFWGILGALVMRGAMIAIGAKLVAEFSWMLSVFGALLIVTAIKMAFMGEGSSDPGHNIIVRLMRRCLPVTNHFDGEHFFVRAPASIETVDGAGFRAAAVASPARRGRWMMTPLAPALVMVETTDLVFAVDSIPAIFAITADPFLVFTSNVFAILGLRSLYFALAGALHTFRYLKHALALVLLTVGVKMLVHSWLEQVLGPNFNLYMLATVIVILGTGVLLSLIGREARLEQETP